jgi:ABC-2 type transport system ATP-binding protein
VAAGPVDEVLARGRATRLVVGVDDAERAVAVLRDAGVDASLGGDRVLVSLPASEAASVTRLLAERGLYLSELRPEEISLEDVFLELTGEGLRGQETTS